MNFDLQDFERRYRTGNGLLPVPVGKLTANQYRELMQYVWLPQMTPREKFYKSRDQAFQILHKYNLIINWHWRFVGGHQPDDYNYPGQKLILWPEDANPPCKIFKSPLNFPVAPEQPRTLSTVVKPIEFLEKDIQSNPRLKAFKNWSGSDKMHHWVPTVPNSHPLNSYFMPS